VRHKAVGIQNSKLSKKLPETAGSEITKYGLNAPHAETSCSFHIRSFARLGKINARKIGHRR
jgi:hypothetical protein